MQSSQADPAKWGGGNWLLRSGLEAGGIKESQMQENLTWTGFLEEAGQALNLERQGCWLSVSEEYKVRFI